MSKCTIVINTCDAYNDVWELFFKAFEEYWPDCEYNIVLNTEKIKCNLSNVTTHTFNETSTLDNWGKRFKQTLQDIDSDFVIMLYDDFILEGNVNKNKIKQCIKWLEDEKIKIFVHFILFIVKIRILMMANLKALNVYPLKLIINLILLLPFGKKIS